MKPAAEPPRYAFVDEYRRHTARLFAENPDENRAASLAVGGSWDAVGTLQISCLLDLGLAPGHSVVEVGCGSGRLASRLDGYLQGPYLGTDVVPELLDYARVRWGRPNWRFEPVEDLTIPAGGGSADFVVMFSVLTHLLHEHSYILLAEAKRVLRKGGLIVASFLEFAEPATWAVFEQMVAAPLGRHHNQFINRDDLQVWADHLDLGLVRVIPGSAPIRFEGEITFDDGRTFAGEANLGQAIAVLGRADATAG